MIVRSILTNFDQPFDYFNDAKDTMEWLAGELRRHRLALQFLQASFADWRFEQMKKPPVPNGVEEPDQPQGRMMLAALTNSAIRHMAMRFGHSKEPIHVMTERYESLYRQFRWVCQHDPKAYAELVAKVGLDADFEKQLAVEWLKDLRYISDKAVKANFPKLDIGS